MKKKKFLMFYLSFLAIFTAGCSNQAAETQSAVDNGIEGIVIEKRMADKYEVSKTLTDNEQVQDVKEMINAIHWEDAKIMMVDPPDYRFSFSYNSKGKAQTLGLWIHSNKDSVELIMEQKNKYAKTGKKHSAKPLNLLTGPE